MLRPTEEKTDRNSPVVTLTLQSLIDARHNINRNRGRSRVGGSHLPGQHTLRRRGQGTEFIDLRQYNEGDDVRHIDWNVTARSNEPYTRLYREEREQVTTVIVDLRPMMFTGSDCLRSVSAGQFAACTLWQASEHGDRCAAVVVNAHGITSSRPGTGKNGVLRALELIASGFTATDNLIHQRDTIAGNKVAATAPVLSDTLTLISKNKRSSGRYIMFSGLDTKDDSLWHILLPSTAMARQLQVVLLLDRLEEQPLPAGTYQFQSGHGATATTLNTKNSKQYALQLQKNLQARSQAVTSNGIPLITVPVTLPSAELLTLLQQDGWL